MGIQINPVAVALLVTVALTAGFFALYDGGEPEVAAADEESAYAGKPLPTIFYKNHSDTDDSQRLARESSSALDAGPSAQLVVHPVNASPDTSTRRYPVPVSSESSRRNSRSSGGSSSSADDTSDTPVNVTPANTTTTANATNSTNSTPVNSTNVTVTPPPLNLTNVTNRTNTTIIPPLVNTTNTTPAVPVVNVTPQVDVTLSIEAGFPQDQNVVFTCEADGATKYSWDFDHGKDIKNGPSTVFHTFPQSGTYTVECSVKVGGVEASATKTVTITAPLEVDDDYPYAAFITAEGEEAVRTLTCEDVGFTADEYTWTISGGAYESTVPDVNFFEGAGKTLTHTFPAAGDYEVQCEAISFDDRMRDAYWEEGVVCNSSHGCVTASAEEDIEIDLAAPPAENNETNSTEDDEQADARERAINEFIDSVLAQINGTNTTG